MRYWQLNFTTWCDDHYLLLNVKKTKELLIDFRIKKDPLQPITIKNEVVDTVDSYKYLGVTIDSNLDWHAHSSFVQSKSYNSMSSGNLKKHRVKRIIK